MRKKQKIVRDLDPSMYDNIKKLRKENYSCSDIADLLGVARKDVERTIIKWQI